MRSSLPPLSCLLLTPTLVGSWVIGCGGEAGPVAEGPPLPDVTYRPCASAARLGGFSLRLDEGFSAVEGRVFDGVVPGNVRDETARDGACVLLQGRRLVCDPPCGAGQTCDVGGACIAYPRARSVGVVTVRGLKDALTLEPSRGYYSSAAVTLTHPAFDEDAPLTLEAAGAELPGFTLEVRGVAPLEAPEGAVQLERGAPLRLRWMPARSAAARVRAVVDLAHHGGIAASLECDGLADSGAAELPARLVERLLDIGVAGFPTVTLARRSVDSVALAPGCVELGAVSEAVRPIAVPGLQSCTADEDCSEGQSCRSDLTCGE